MYHKTEPNKTKWPHSSCFVDCIFQDLFRIAHSILCISHRAFSPCFSFASRWRNLVLFYQRSDFRMIDNPSIVVHALYRRMLTSLSVDEILLLSNLNWSTNFKGFLLKVKIAFYLKHMNWYIWIHLESNAFYYLLQAMLMGFGLGRCIYEKH